MEKKLHLYILPFVLIGLAICQEVVISPKQDTLVKKISEGMSLQCAVEGLAEGDTPTIQWFNANGEHVTLNKGRMKIMVLSSKELVLVVRDLQDGDEGQYTCKATINGNPVEKNIEIQLYRGIVISGSPLIQKPNIYTDAFIECNADSNPTPTIHWTFGNESSISSGGRYVQQKEGLIIKNISESDNGLYYCKINVIEMGEYLEYNVTIKVTLPPKSSRPATFNPAVVGKRFEMSCYATGNPPPVFTFYKDENPQPLDGPKYKVDKSSGRLEVEKMEESDSGDYRCEASNTADGVRGTTTGGKIEEIVNVVVLVPPKIVSVSDISKPENEAGELVCVAEGNPAPDMTWRKFGMDTAYVQDASGIVQRANLDSSTEELPSGLKRSTLKLIFTSLKPKDTNTYVCTAINTAGTASENGTIRVEFQPNFDDTPYIQTYGWANHRSDVKCIANGEPEAFIIWSRHGEEINENTTFQITSKHHKGSVTSTLSVSVLLDNENWIYGDYTCMASNTHGSTKQPITFSQAKTPGTAIVQTDQTTPTSIEMLITPPANDGGQPVIDYKIEYNLQGSTDIKTTTAPRPPSSSGDDRTKARIVDLTANSVYKITVRARNNVGYGSPQTLSEETPNVRKPDPVSFESQGLGENPDFYIVSWYKPLTGGKPITGYKINYNRVEVKGESESTWTVDRLLDQLIHKQVKGDVRSYRLELLAPNTYYQVEVIAINLLGESEGRKMIFKTSKGDASYQPVTGDPMIEEFPAPKHETRPASPVQDGSFAPAPLASISSICMALLVCLACLVW